MVVVLVFMIERFCGDLLALVLFFVGLTVFF